MLGAAAACPLPLDIAAPPGQGEAIVQGYQNGNGGPGPRGSHDAGLRFFLVEDGRYGDGHPMWPDATPSGSRLAGARTALREAQQGEWEERQRVARARVEALTPAHAALLQARQAQTRAAQSTVDELARRAAWLRQALSLAEQALAQQRHLVDRLRRELTEIGE
jgi:hypothetical protein